MATRQYSLVAAVVGRPNAGKSTLVNALIGQKIAITSHRPQTTRHRIHGVHTMENTQFVFIDTPGINEKTSSAFLSALNKTTRSALVDADLVLLVLDGLQWNRLEEAVLKYIFGDRSERRRQSGCVVIINKADYYRRKRSDLMTFLKQVSNKADFDEIVPLSAKRRKDIIYLENLLKRYAKPRGFIFAEEQVTDQSMRFYISELIREKILRRFNQEIPYSAAVVINEYVEKQSSIVITATIHVEQESHKQIIIGKGGSSIREVGKQVRQQLEKETARHVTMRLWVKVSHAWSSNPGLIRDLGYESP